MDDVHKQFMELAKRAEAAIRKIPLLVGNEGKNFFQSRFKTQDWLDSRTEPWKKRKPTAKRNKGRAVLTDTGKGKRSIRVMQADWNGIKVGTDIPYMAAHNKGVKRAVRVGEHSRVASRKVSTRFNAKGKGLKTGRKKIRGAGHQVKAHSRKMNLPKRQFIGESDYLNKRIDRLIMSQILKATK